MGVWVERKQEALRTVECLKIRNLEKEGQGHLRV